MWIGNVSIFCILSAMVLGGCGKAPTNTDIPKAVDLLTPTDNNDKTSTLEKKWNAFIKYIGLEKLYQPSLAELRKSLSVPPKASSSTLMPENYSAIRAGIVKSVIEQASETQCDVSTLSLSNYNRSFVFNSDGTKTDLLANTYLMRFKTYKKQDKGDGYHYAFVVLPDDLIGNQKYPLAVYGRASDSGLLLNEVLTLGQTYYKEYIIVAPAYPGDVVWGKECPTREKSQLCLEDYKSEIPQNSFEGDAYVHLAAQNCLTKIQNLNDLNFFSSSNGLSTNPFKNKIKTHGNLSKAIALGMDRGGLSAQLSVAYSGVYAANGLGTANTTLSESFKNQNGVDFVPNLISSIGVIGSPSSFLMASYRVGLEHAFKGRLGLTPFKKLPGFLALQDLFSSIRNAPIENLEEAVSKAAVEIAKRDLLFMGGFMGVGLQNWTKKLSNSPSLSPGAAAYFHGTQDVVVPYDQAKVAYSVASEFHKVVDSGGLSGVPGYSYGVFSFQPQDSDLVECGTNKCLKSSLLQHADKTFMSSLFVSTFTEENLAARDQSQAGDSALATAIYKEAGSSGVVLGSVRQALYYLSQSIGAARIAKTPPPLYSGDYTAESKYILNPITPPAALVLWMQTLVKSALN